MSVKLRDFLRFVTIASWNHATLKAAESITAFSTVPWLEMTSFCNQSINDEKKVCRNLIEQFDSNHYLCLEKVGRRFSLHLDWGHWSNSSRPTRPSRPVIQNVEWVLCLRCRSRIDCWAPSSMIKNWDPFHGQNCSILKEFSDLECLISKSWSQFICLSVVQAQI